MTKSCTCFAATRLPADADRLPRRALEMEAEHDAMCVDEKPASGSSELVEQFLSGLSASSHGASRFYTHLLPRVQTLVPECLSSWCELEPQHDEVSALPESEAEAESDDEEGIAFATSCLVEDPEREPEVTALDEREPDDDEVLDISRLFEPPGLGAGVGLDEQFGEASGLSCGHGGRVLPAGEFPRVARTLLLGVAELGQSLEVVGEEKPGPGLEGPEQASSDPGVEEFVKSCIKDEESDELVKSCIKEEEWDGHPGSRPAVLVKKPRDKTRRRPKATCKLEQISSLLQRNGYIHTVKEEHQPEEDLTMAEPGGLPSSSSVLGRRSHITDQMLVEFLLRARSRKIGKSGEDVEECAHVFNHEDVYCFTGERLDEFSLRKNSPAFFLLSTSYLRVNKGRKITRFRSAPLGRLRGSCAAQARRWMQRGKTKYFHHGGVAYGKTYFSFGLRNCVGRRKARTAANSKARESEDEAEFRRRKQKKARKNTYQMYEIFLKADAERERKRLKEAEMPESYHVICVLKF